MSSAVVSTSAALGRPFLFDAEPEPEVCCHPERSEKCAKRVSRGVEEPALSLPKGSLPYSKLSPDPRLASITSASRLEIRPAPEMVTSGIPALDALTGGLPRGCLTEICGPASSGRTTVLLAALATATRRGEYCAVIDASDALDPHSLAAAGIDLDHLLWVRCNENSPQRHGDTEKANCGKNFIPNNTVDPGMIGKGTALAVPYGTPTDAALAAGGRRFHLKECLFGEADRGSKARIDKYDSGEASRNRKQSEHRLEQVLRATDLLLESGGFGLIILDLADLPQEAARRIPLTTWFRFRRAVEHKPTILLSIEQQPIAGSCSSLLLQLGPQKDSEETMHSKKPSSSREAATWESPARQCRVSPEKGTQSRRDGIDFGGIVADGSPNVLHIAHPTHAHLMTGLQIHAELIRSRLDRKPAHSITFETKTAWAG